MCVRDALWRLKQPAHYYVFDLNCGCGENRTNGANCKGSPLLMSQALKDNQVPGKLFLCDKSPKALKNIGRVLEGDQLMLFREKSWVSHYPIQEDNAVFAGRIPDIVRADGRTPSKVLGIIISDPNGLHVPVREIGRSVQECPLLDVMIHICGALRVWSYWKNHPSGKFSPTDRTVRSFSEIFSIITKKNWLLSVPFRGNGGPDHHVLYGTNSPYVREIIDKPGRPDMYNINSVKGSQLMYEYQQLEVAA